jgi:cytosine/uracil/thiamine/allantoin permease
MDVLCEGACAVGIAVALLGLVVSPLDFLYDYAWFVGFAVAGGLYIALMRCSPGPVKVPEWEAEG